MLLKITLGTEKNQIYGRRILRNQTMIKEYLENNNNENFIFYNLKYEINVIRSILVFIKCIFKERVKQVC